MNGLDNMNTVSVVLYSLMMYDVARRSIIIISLCQLHNYFVQVKRVELAT